MPVSARIQEKPPRRVRTRSVRGGSPEYRRTARDRVGSRSLIAPRTSVEQMFYNDWFPIPYIAFMVALFIGAMVLVVTSRG